MPQAGRTHGKGAAAKLHNAEHLLIAVTVAGVNNRQRTTAAKGPRNHPRADKQQLVPRPLMKGRLLFALLIVKKPSDGGNRYEHAQRPFQSKLRQVLQRKKNQSACQ